MQSSTQRLYPATVGAYVSEHRFRLALALSLLVLVVMIAAVHGTVGLGPPFALSVSP